MSFVCPKCVESEVVAHDGSRWLTCPSCGRGYDEDDLAEYYERKEVRDQAGEIRSCWNLQERLNREPGGGDDGLSMTWDIPVNEEHQCIVSVRTEKVGGRKVLRIKGLERPSTIVRGAINRLLGRDGLDMS